MGVGKKLSAGWQIWLIAWIALLGIALSVTFFGQQFTLVDIGFSAREGAAHASIQTEKDAVAFWIATEFLIVTLLIIVTWAAVKFYQLKTYAAKAAYGKKPRGKS